MLIVNYFIHFFSIWLIPFYFFIEARTRKTPVKANQTLNPLLTNGVYMSTIGLYLEEFL